MKTVITGLFIFSFFSIFSQDSCVVKVCLNDCLNCYGGMKHIEAGNDKIKKTIVFPEISQAEINQYLKNVLNISDTHKFNIVVSDSIYNSLNNSLSSEVYVYDKNKLTDHSLLKKFSGFAESEPFEIQIPDTIAISGSSSIINNEDYFFISDYMFGQFIFIKKSEENRIFRITAPELTTRENFTKITGDTTSYFLFEKYGKYLKSSNLDAVRIQSTSGCRNEMVSFLLVPVMKELDTAIDVTLKSGIIVFNNPFDYRILRIDDELLPENYYINPGSLSIYKDKYYVQMGKLDTITKKIYVLGKFSLSDDVLSYAGFPGYEMPKEYLPVNKYKHLGKILTFIDPYVFLQYSLSYFDLESRKTYELPFEPVNLKFTFNINDAHLNEISSNYIFTDAFLTKHTIQVLYKKSERYYIAVIDRMDHHLKNRKEITNPVKNIKSGLRFYSADELYYLSKNNTIVVEQIMYD